MTTVSQSLNSLLQNKNDPSIQLRSYWCPLHCIFYPTASHIWRFSFAPMLTNPYPSLKLYVTQKPNLLTLWKGKQNSVSILGAALLSIKQEVPILPLLLIINNYQRDQVTSSSIYKMPITKTAMSPLLSVLLYTRLMWSASKRTLISWKTLISFDFYPQKVNSRNLASFYNQWKQINTSRSN